MDDKEFLDWHQKQKDYEDELKQQEHQDKTAIWRKMLGWATGVAARKGMTLNEFIAWVELYPKHQGFAEFLKKLEQWSK